MHPSGATSIQGPSETRDRNGHRQQREPRERQRVVLQIRHDRALEHDAAHDADVMGERQEFADPLRPSGHARKRKQEARKQNVGQEEEKRHLHVFS